MHVGQDSKWAKPPAWAKKEGEDHSIPATESHIGEGKTEGTDGKTGTADAEQPAGQTQPAA